MRIQKMIGWTTYMLISAFTILGCEEDEKVVALEESLDTWKAWQRQKDDTYFYETGYGSWTGSGSNTYILVENGVVTARLFKEYQPVEPEDTEVVVTDVYIERGNSLGKNDRGAAPLKIEQLYSICRDDVLEKDPDENHIFLDFRDDGILDTCVYTPKNCADDCSEGVRIFDLSADTQAFETLVDEIMNTDG